MPAHASSQSTPSRQLFLWKAKAVRMSSLRRMRKRHENLERERVETLKGIWEGLKVANRIQQKLNEIMEKRNSILVNMIQAQKEM